MIFEHLLICCCPAQVPQTLQLLTDIIAAHESSLHNASPTKKQQQDTDKDKDSSASTDAGDDLSPVLSAVLDPLLDMVMRSAEALSPDSPARLDDGGKLDPTAHKVITGTCQQGQLDLAPPLLALYCGGQWIAVRSLILNGCWCSLLPWWYHAPVYLGCSR